MEEEPVKDIGTYCSEPYTCAYWKYCWRHIPENSVFDIRRMSNDQKFKFYNDGIITFEDIVKNQPKMSAKFYKQVYTAYNHEPPTINKEKIKEFLDSLSYPIYHLDFETFQKAVPEYEGCKPYQQIPFQYSLHIEHEDGTLEHKEFLAKEGVDPRRALTEQLVKDIPLDAFSMAYNMKFEKMVISELASIFPDLSDKLMNIHSNMHDLMVPFQYQYYYSEALKGSYSIKYVLPALCPDDPALDYHNLDQVHNGLEASSAFANMVNLEPEEIKELRANLLKYCGLDTYAMVKVLGKLKEMCD